MTFKIINPGYNTPRMIKILIAFMTLFGVHSAALAIEINDQAPDFSLVDVQGGEHRLAQYRGKMVVLEWFNYDCPFVKKHYESGNMQNLQSKWVAKGVIWLSINSSAPGKQGHYPAEVLRKMADERKVSSTAVLIDGNGTAGKLYHAETTPHFFIVNPEGQLVYQGAIDDKPSTDPADIATAQNYIDNALSQLEKGEVISVPVTKSYGCSVKY